MKAARAALLFWSALIVGLLIIEFAQITHVFTLPIDTAFGDPISLLVALVFVTVLALVGAMFIGLYFSARVMRAQGFTPFEEEMLRMRAEVRDIKVAVERTPDAATAPPTEPRGRGGS